MPRRPKALRSHLREHEKEFWGGGKSPRILFDINNFYCPCNIYVNQTPGHVRQKQYRTVYELPGMAYQMGVADSAMAGHRITG